jgi:hypothetical protein
MQLYLPVRAVETLELVGFWKSFVIMNALQREPDFTSRAWT